MGPKKIPPTTPTFLQANPEETTHADLVAKIAELTTTLASFGTRFDKLEKLWTDAKSENRMLKDALQEKEREITNIRERLNDQEQYTRSWCVRVLHMKIPQQDETDPYKVMQHVYEKLLLPILRGAVTKGLIQHIPSAEQILETAHILPCKPGTTPPIIARFYSRNIRAMIFKLKKEYAPRAATEPAAGTRSKDLRSGKLTYLLFEDLTRPTFSKMRAIAQHDSVENCWSVSGSLRYKLVNDPNIYKVKSIFSTVEQILAKSKPGAVS
jgi:hypothetical protein